MKEETMRNFIQTVQEESPTDMLIVACDDEENINSAITGDLNKIGYAMLTNILEDSNKDKQKVGEELYTLIKNIAYSIVCSNSRYSTDMLNMMETIISARMESKQDLKMSSKTKIIPLYGSNND